MQFPGTSVEHSTEYSLPFIENTMLQPVWLDPVTLETVQGEYNQRATALGKKIFEKDVYNQLNTALQDAIHDVSPTGELSHLTNAQYRTILQKLHARLEAPLSQLLADHQFSAVSSYSIQSDVRAKGKVLALQALFKKIEQNTFIQFDEFNVSVTTLDAALDAIKKTTSVEAAVKKNFNAPSSIWNRNGSVSTYTAFGETFVKKFVELVVDDVSTKWHFRIEGQGFELCKVNVDNPNSQFPLIVSLGGTTHICIRPYPPKPYETRNVTCVSLSSVTNLKRDIKGTIEGDTVGARLTYVHDYAKELQPICDQFLGNPDATPANSTIAAPIEQSAVQNEENLSPQNNMTVDLSKFHIDELETKIGELTLPSQCDSITFSGFTKRKYDCSVQYQDFYYGLVVHSIIDVIERHSSIKAVTIDTSCSFKAFDNNDIIMDVAVKSLVSYLAENETLTEIAINSSIGTKGIKEFGDKLKEMNTTLQTLTLGAIVLDDATKFVTAIQSTNITSLHLPKLIISDRGDQTRVDAFAQAVNSKTSLKALTLGSISILKATQLVTATTTSEIESLHLPRLLIGTTALPANVDALVQAVNSNTTLQRVELQWDDQWNEMLLGNPKLVRLNTN